MICEITEKNLHNLCSDASGLCSADTSGCTQSVPTTAPTSGGGGQLPPTPVPSPTIIQGCYGSGGGSNGCATSCSAHCGVESCSATCQGDSSYSWCSYTCGGSCPGDIWGGWSTCSYDSSSGKYYQERWCTGNSQLYQISQCVPDVTGPTSPPVGGGGGGGGGNPTNTPIPPTPTRIRTPTPTPPRTPTPRGPTPTPSRTPTPGGPTSTPSGPTPTLPAPPRPRATCGIYDPLSGTTPITWTWTPVQSSGLQVWDSNGTWYFNDWTTSPYTTAGIPTGLTATGRTTYDFSTFSSYRNITCAIPTPTTIITPTATPTATPSPTPTPTPTPGPWTKLKNSSYLSNSSLLDPIPVNPLAYDSDDDTNPYFITGNAGLTAASFIDITNLNPSAKVSGSNWSVTGYSLTSALDPAGYLSYVKARKAYQTITSLNQITSNGIYFYNGDLTISSLPAAFNSYNVVLISSGTININTDLNKVSDPSLKQIALLAPTINFDPSVSQADGIFIAGTVTTGTTVNQGLKIVGNLIAQTSFSNNRRWNNLNRPVLFIVFDQQKYIDLLPYLSTSSYDWRETQ